MNKPNYNLILHLLEKSEGDLSLLTKDEHYALIDLIDKFCADNDIILDDDICQAN